MENSVIPFKELIRWLKKQLEQEGSESEILDIRVSENKPDTIVFSTIYGKTNIKVTVSGGNFQLTLPSGRVIVYENPKAGCESN